VPCPEQSGGPKGQVRAGAGVGVCEKRGKKERKKEEESMRKREREEVERKKEREEV